MSTDARNAAEISNQLSRAKWLIAHREEYEVKLLKRIKQQLPELEKLLAEVDDHHSGLEDGVYRFYHGSFKVYRVQGITEAVRDALEALLPDQALNESFRHIVDQGTGKKFEASSDENWLQKNRPILEAAFHARYFLKMVCRYGRELNTPPQALPSGWAAVLYLYGLR